MRGNSDRDVLYPFSVTPANGWGHENPTDEYVIYDVRQIGKALAVDGTNFKIVLIDEATRYPDPASAAIAAGKIVEHINTPKAA